MKFKVTEYITDYVRVGDEYRTIEVEKKYEIHNWDDLQNLLSTIIDFSMKKTKFEVEKEEVTD
jgi:hypothetical protein